MKNMQKSFILSCKKTFCQGKSIEILRKQTNKHIYTVWNISEEWNNTIK